jgi:hypothetical protein
MDREAVRVVEALVATARIQQQQQQQQHGGASLQPTSPASSSGPVPSHVLQK